MNIRLPRFIYRSLPYLCMVGGAVMMYMLRGWKGGWIGGIVGLVLLTYGFAILMLRKDADEQDRGDGPPSRYDDSRFNDIRVQSDLFSSKASKNKGPPTRGRS